MVRLRNVLDKYIKIMKCLNGLNIFKDNDIQYLYPSKKYYFLLNIKNNNMFGGDEYTLDLKIRGIKYKVNIVEYTDIIYTQTKNNSLNNKEELKK